MDRTFVKLPDGKYGIFGEHTKVFSEDNKVIVKDGNYETVEWRRVPVATRALLNEIYKYKLERISRYNIMEANKNKIEELEKQIQEIKNSNANLDKEWNGFQKKINALVKEYDEHQEYKLVLKETKGNEQLKMSFYDGTLNRPKAKAIINKDKSGRKLTYTYGLGYRNPTTYHKPITLEEAMDIISEESLLDITFGENEIHLNAYSSNDMW